VFFEKGEFEMKKTLTGILIFAAALVLAPALRADEPEPPPEGIINRDFFAPGAFLGVSTMDVTPELRAFLGAPKDSGVLVGRVSPDSPAAKAGIKVGDVIVRVDGHEVDSPWRLARVLRDKKSGNPVSIDIIRDHGARTLSAKLAERKEGPEIVVEKRKLLNGERFPDGDFGRFEEMFKTPMWQGRLDNVEECEKVRDRLKIVEDRLRALEQKLEKK
jgi:membrane-associated protease RseP (regulator of RpoE activity)